MSKFYKIFSFLFIAGLVFSCSKEEFEQEEILPPAGYEVVNFQVASEFSKTTISGEGSTKTVEWTKGDVIDIFWTPVDGESGTTTAMATVSGTSTQFRAAVPEGVTDFYAAYPSGLASFDDGTVTVVMPSEVNGSFENANLMATKLSRTQTSIFKSVAAMLKFEVTDQEATAIRIVSRDMELKPALRGTLPVTFDEDGNMTVGTFTKGRTETKMNFTGAGVYYMPIIADYEIVDGFDVEYFKNNVVTSSLAVDFSFQLGRSYIADFGVIEQKVTPEIHYEYYVTPEGAGTKDGTSWSNAFGIQEFKEVIERSTDETSEVAKPKEDALRNSIFRLEGGTYDLGELVALGFSDHCKKYINFTIEGGFYNGSKDAANHPTVFSGGGEHRIFSLERYADVAIIDCNIENSLGAGGGQAAIRMGSKYTKLQLIRCNFTGNVNSATAGALNIGYGTATLIECGFYGNSATYGAAINIDNGAEGATDISGDVVLNSCVFDGNSATGDGNSAGGALRLNAGGPVSVTGCEFYNNSSKFGGAVHAGKANSTFTNCIFGSADNGNTANGSGARGGAVRCSGDSGNHVFTNCTFSSNEGGFGGAIFMENFSGTVTVNGGSFTANKTTSSSGEGAAIRQSSGTLSVSNADFDNNQAYRGGVFSSTDGNAQFKDCNLGKTTRNGSSSQGGCIILSDSAAPVFTGCYIRGNGSTGGGIRTNGSAHPTFTNCEFVDCLAGNGGAVYVDNTACPTFKGCLFQDCTSKGSDKLGGAIYIGKVDACPVIENCTFKNNTAGYRGGSIYSESTCSGGIAINDCTFSFCYAPDEGAAIDVRAGTKTTINNCSFIENISPWGAVYAGDEGTVVDINGGIFKDNEAKKDSSAKPGAALCTGDGTTIRCNGVVFDGNKASAGAVFRNESSNFKAYFNACSFKENNWSDNYGGMMKIAESKSNNVLCLNNCSGYHNYSNGSSKSGQQCTWINLPTNNGVKFVIANTSFIGNLQDKNGNATNGTVSGSGPGIIRIDNKNNAASVKLYMVNNILMKKDANTNYGVASTIDSYAAQYCNYNKGSSKNIGGKQEPSGYFDSDGRSYSNFGSLAWDDSSNLWTWNGEKSGINNLGKTADINAAISAADSDFYAWLVSIGAISSDGTTAVDARGTTRGTNSWPGSYDRGNK